MKKTLIALFFCGMSAQLAAWSVDPRPLRATLISLGNVIAVALASEDNERVGSVFVLQSPEKVDADFLYRRIALREEYLVLWPKDHMDEPYVLTLADNTRYEEALTADSRPKATILSGTTFYKIDRYWPAPFSETVTLMKQGHFNKELGLH